MLINHIETFRNLTVCCLRTSPSLNTV